MKRDVNIVLIDFPTRGKEMITENEDGSFTVLINARLSYEEQIKAYEHAMRHVENADFTKKDVQIIESNTHNQASSPDKDK